jgi:four helix bundle protein
LIFESGDGGCEIWDVGYGVNGSKTSDLKKFKSYRDLEVYTLAHALGVEIHHFSLKLPKYEHYEMGGQLRRSTKSISANIVEGFCRRRYKPEFIRFIIFAHGSCNESIEWLEYIKECHTDLAEDAESFLIRLDQLGRKLNRFISAIQRDHIP